GGSPLEECFGPAALLVEYSSTEDLAGALEAVPGSLTATLHADPDREPELASFLLDRLTRRAGRVIFGGWPTGVAVSWAQPGGRLRDGPGGVEAGDLGDGGPLVGVGGVDGQERVEHLDGHVGGEAGEAEGEHVRVVPAPRAPGDPGLPGQRRPRAGHLVRRH